MTSSQLFPNPIDDNTYKDVYVEIACHVDNPNAVASHVQRVLDARFKKPYALSVRDNCVIVQTKTCYLRALDNALHEWYDGSMYGMKQYLEFRRSCED